MMTMTLLDSFCAAKSLIVSVGHVPLLSSVAPHRCDLLQLAAVTLHCAVALDRHHMVNSHHSLRHSDASFRHEMFWRPVVLDGRPSRVMLYFPLHWSAAARAQTSPA